ncbi:MAG: hypothetical protein RR327_02220 [Clostridia bacterium]
MEENFIYLIGEAIAMEIESVSDITYPKGEENPTQLLIELKDGKKFKLTLNEEK